MVSFLLFLCALLLCPVTLNGAKDEEYFHVPVTDVMMDKVKYAGWQEPGIWRPKWYLYRNIVDSNDPSKVKTERLCIKFNSDRTLKIFRPEYRKLVDWRDPKTMAEEIKLNDSPNVPTSAEDVASAKDGTWWWQDNKDGTGSVKLEIKNKIPRKTRITNSEGEISVEDEDLGLSNVMIHETTLTFGKLLDPYAVYFRDGFVSEYKDQKSKSGLPVGTKKTGFFSIRANANRPLLSKEFLAFQ